MKKEAITHGVLDDLANRNENWEKLDGVPEKVDLLTDELGLIKDYVIDSGSNPNGSWEKWNSGKLIQWGRGAASVSTINDGYQQIQTYPVPFVGTLPYLGLTSQIRFSQGECVVSSESLSGFTTYALRKDATYDTRYSWKSVGRWK